jgi:imidazolonepropionase-like amidohydrolase
MPQILFTNAKLLDPRADALQGGVSVLVEDDLIREVSAARIKAPRAQVLDCKGRTLMPGLIDSHVHVMLSEVNLRALEAVPLTLMTARAAGLMRAMLDRGFTTVRDTGGADWGLRDAVAQGELPGPRLFIAGRAIGPSRRALRPAPAHRHLPRACATAATPCASASTWWTAWTRCARPCASKLRQGVDQIKIMVSGGVASPYDPWTACSSRSARSPRRWRRRTPSGATCRRTPTHPRRSRAR